MKNLYEQLTKEVKDAVKKSNENHPMIQERFEEDMKALRHSTEVPIGDAHSLYALMYPLEIFGLTNYFKIFGQ